MYAELRGTGQFDILDLPSDEVCPPYISISMTCVQQVHCSISLQILMCMQAEHSLELQMAYLVYVMG